MSASRAWVCRSRLWLRSHAIRARGREASSCGPARQGLGVILGSAFGAQLAKLTHGRGRGR
eukprot:scaffold23627_cov121-Isochrysis_galbana.AAC.2